MIPADYVFQNLSGAFRVLRLDRGGLAFFATDERAFWRSFFAAVISAPIYAAAYADNLARHAAASPAWRIFAVEGLVYVVGWLAYPVVIHLVCRAIGRVERFVPYVVAYNWTMVPVGALMAIVALIRLSGLPESVTGVAGLVAVLYTLGVLWFMARHALDLGGFAAAGVVALDMLLSLVVTGAGEALLTPRPAQL